MYLLYLFCPLLWFFHKAFERGWLGFPRDFSDHFPDCTGFGGEVKFVYIV